MHLQMNKLFLVYQNKGNLEVFEVAPRYIKGQKLSARIIEENKIRSFAFSMMYGVFADREAADNLIIELNRVRLPDPRLAKFESKIEKLQAKLDRNEDQQDRLEGRLEKKHATIERLQENENLTESQAEQLQKAETAVHELEEKATELDEAHYAMETQIKRLEQERGCIEEDSGNAEMDFWEAKLKLCAKEIQSMGIDVRPEQIKSSKKPAVASGNDCSRKSDAEGSTKGSFFSRLFGRK